MRQLEVNEQKARKDLLKKCKENSGAYLPAHHGSGSWATTYSSAFIDAATSLCYLYKNAGAKWPYVELAKDLRGADIMTCRGAYFSYDRAEYLYKTHIAAHLS